MRVARVVLLVIAILLALAPVVSAWISPPRAGQDHSEALGIPYRAVVAHRGLSYHAPEETEPAYVAARELGADYLEGDVQRTRDGVLILLHDDTLERTTNVSAIYPGRVAQTVDQFTWAELERLDAGSWFNASYPERAREKYVGLKVLRLERLLDLARSGSHSPGIYLETKAASRFPGIEEQLIAMLRARGWIGAAAAASESGPRARLILQSFEADSLRKLAALAPEVPRVYLIDQDMVKAQGWAPLLQEAGALGSGIGPVGYEAWPWRTGPAHSAGLIVHPYTIDKAWQMRLLAFFGADGFFTNRAELQLVLEGRRDPKQRMDDFLSAQGF
ncbi:MAG: hypothetical protein K1X75_11705 [Leptospirales bacterium]|nr:hypothetical protein [Leptospirales bacterium]